MAKTKTKTKQLKVEMSLERMRELGLGSDVRGKGEPWRQKREDLYKALGVWDYFWRRRDVYKQLNAPGVGNGTLANQLAQEEVDGYIERQVKGEAVEWPPYDRGLRKGLLAKTISEDGPDGLYDPSEFSEDESVDRLDEFTWVFNNILIRDVQPSDAPSPGAFAYLKWVQTNKANEAVFFTSVLPRTLPTKSQIDNRSKFNDDGRSNIDLLDRLLTESEDSEE